MAANRCTLHAIVNKWTKKNTADFTVCRVNDEKVNKKKLFLL